MDPYHKSVQHQAQDQEMQDQSNSEGQLNQNQQQQQQPNKIKISLPILGASASDQPPRTDEYMVEDDEDYGEENDFQGDGDLVEGDQALQAKDPFTNGQETQQQLLSQGAEQQQMTAYPNAYQTGKDLSEGQLISIPFQDSTYSPPQQQPVPDVNTTKIALNFGSHASLKQQYSPSGNHSNEHVRGPQASNKQSSPKSEQKTTINIPRQQTSEFLAQSQPMETQPQPTCISIPQQVGTSSVGFDDTSQAKSRKHKHKKKKGKGDLMSLYSLKKSRLTMELDPYNLRMRGQLIYTLILKDQPVVEEIINRLIAEGISKYNFDLDIQAKLIDVIEVCLLSESKEKEEKLGFDYPTPSEQAQFQQHAFGGISRDLHSLEVKQKQIYENEQQLPLLKAKRVLKLNLKKDLLGQIRPQIRILVSYFVDKICDFGIKQVQYKQTDQWQNKGNQTITGDQAMRSYFYTSDNYDSASLWMPVIKGTLSLPISWTLRYIVPHDHILVSSGNLTSRTTEATESKRTLFIYKLKDEDKAIAGKIGFVLGNFPYMYKSWELSQKKCSQGFLTFFLSKRKEEVFKHKGFYEKNIEAIISYLEKLINAKYPCDSSKLVFVPNLVLQKSRKQSFDFAGGLHILDEELLFQSNQLENRYHTYKHLASTLSFDFFGGKVHEEDSGDHWLLLGIRESLGNHFKIAKCGILLYRYQVMKTIESVYHKMKKGIERYPLQSNQQPHPAEQQFNDLVYEKCELIMHMIESMIDKSYYERILRQLYATALSSQTPTISAGLFLQIFKQVCGFKLKQFCQNWILSTSCPKLKASYSYNKKNNSLDLQITQTSAMKDHFLFRKYLKQNIDMGTLFTTPIHGPEMKQAMKKLESVDSFYVELKRECMRWFTGEVNVMIYLTDGAEIQTQQQKMSLKFGKTTAHVNVPLHYKVKKTIQNKKKEYENMLMYDTEMGEEHAEDQDEAGAHGHHMMDNSQWKFGLNEFELEEFPYGTKNLFEVKNLESPVLWIRVDPDMEFIRNVKVKQERENWLFQLLQEKDIIGQIEAIRQLQRTNSELVYEILKSVSSNENYFFKVRKQAIRSLQQMQTSSFNKYLSHEKFFIKVFNQRNFDRRIGFYKSNNFSRVLEYQIDKCILKTLAKCKEHPLKLKEEVKEQHLSLNKQQSMALGQGGGTAGAGDAANPSSISINIVDNEVVSAGLSNKKQKQIDESVYNISSEQTAQLFIKLLQENDNSENPFDDSFYLKNILTSLGKLDSLRYMPEIAQEIYRQFKLDQISKLSPQFAITKGAIAGLYNLRKQIFKIRKDKLQNIDPALEDMSWYEGQLTQTEAVLSRFQKDIDIIPLDLKWPFEVRIFVTQKQIKHLFFYSNFSFLKAMYLLLKNVDQWQASNNLKMAIEVIKQIAQFLEDKWDCLDFREAYLNNERTKAVVAILWSFICLQHSYLDSELIYWVKRVYHMLYSHEVPYFLKEWQMSQGVVAQKLEYDDIWNKEEEQLQESNIHDDREKHLSKILQSRSAQVIIKTPKGEMTNNNAATREANLDNKLKITLGGLAKQPQMPENEMISLANQGSGPAGGTLNQGPIKINLGGLQIPLTHQNLQQHNQNWKDDSENQQINTLQDYNENDYREDYYGRNIDEQNEEDEESVYDIFADIKFEIEWMQKAWDILGLLWYHEEAGAFLQPVREEDLGSFYAEYLRTIQYPMDFSTIQQKFIQRRYHNPNQFKRDVQVVFSNCKSFNFEESEIYTAAVNLEQLFWEKVAEYQLYDEKSVIRIA